MGWWGMMQPRQAACAHALSVMAYDGRMGAAWGQLAGWSSLVLLLQQRTPAAVGSAIGGSIAHFTLPQGAGAAQHTQTAQHAHPQHTHTHILHTHRSPSAS